MTSVRHLELKNLNFVQIIFGARQHISVCYPSICLSVTLCNKKAVLPQGNRVMPQVFFSVEVRQQHSLQVQV